MTSDLGPTLKRVTSWRAVPHLVKDEPALRELAGLGNEHHRTDGWKIVQCLRAKISAVDCGWTSAYGIEIPASEVRWGSFTLLGFTEHARFAITRRRQIFLTELNLSCYYSERTWRGKPELDWYNHLAAQLD